MLHHLHTIETGWHFEHHFETGTKASFTLNRDQLLSIINRTADSFGKEKHERIVAYLNASSEVIDLKDVFEAYRSSVAEFHSWYEQQLASDGLVELRDYERCLRENKNFSERTWWKTLIRQWLNSEKPPNPYDHLPRWLTPEQISEVYSLPMQSDEQVDKVIEFVDTDHACDEELRELAHEFFRRGTPPSE